MRIQDILCEIKEKKITAKLLEGRSGFGSYEDRKRAEEIGDVRIVCNELAKKGSYGNIYWLLTKLMTKRQRYIFVLYLAEKILPLYEKVYHTNNSIKKYIEATKKYFEDSSIINKKLLSKAGKDALNAVIEANYDWGDWCASKNPFEDTFESYIAAANAADSRDAAHIANNIVNAISYVVDEKEDFCFSIEDQLDPYDIIKNDLVQKGLEIIGV